MRIGIIGSGIAGSLLAGMLRDRPAQDISVFEQAAPGAHAGSGTGLNLGPNALRALRLYQPARHAALRAQSLPWQRWQVALADGTQLLDLDLQDIAPEAGARLRWSELYRLLRAPVADLMRHSHGLTGLDQDAAGRLVPVFATPTGLARDGGFDLLVAADGRFSQLRVLAASAPEADYQGLCIWRLLVPDAAGAPFDDYGQWFCGSNRLLGFRLPGGAAYLAGAFALGEDGQISARMRSLDWQTRLFTPPDAPPCAAVGWMLAQMAQHFPQLHWARIAQTPMLRAAAQDRVLLLGDAAQAMVPTLGQGASQAIEDGVLAGAILARGGTLAEIGALRDPRVAFAREFSRAASDTMLPGADPVAGTLAKAAPEFLVKLARLYGDVPASA